jgi:DNA-directed RNA polymerase subunit K/omega
VGKSKKKSTKFTAAIEARRRARELAGPPPAARVIPDKRLKPPKHKKKLIEE